MLRRQFRDVDHQIRHDEKRPRIDRPVSGAAIRRKSERLRSLAVGTLYATTAVMDPATLPAAEPVRAVRTFDDGFGERQHFVDRARPQPLEILYLRSELTSIPSFEFALRERLARLTAFRHTCYAHVHGVERLNDPEATLTLVSDATPGVRLSDMLDRSDRAHVSLDIDAALCLLRQIVPAVALLHEHAPDMAHGAIAPERIIVTPAARIVIVEHVFGSALERVRYSPERYWQELRIATPRSNTAARFDHRSDVLQLGIVALSLILGRGLLDDEYPSRLAEVVGSAWAISARGGLEPLPAGLRQWLSRALQIDARNAFESAIDASEDLDRVLDESDYLAAPATLEAFLERYRAAVDAPAPVPDIKPAIAPVRTPVRASAPEDIPPSLSAPERVVERAPEPVADLAPEVPKPQPSMPPVATPTVQAAVPERPAAPPAQPRPSSATIAAQAAPATSAPMYDTATVAPAHDTAARVQSLTRRWWPYAAAALVVLALAAAGMPISRKLAAPKAPTADGTLAINTSPDGAHVFIDGVERGVTPLSVPLKPGVHALELRGDGPPRLMPITMVAGSQVSQYIELPKAASVFGQLDVRTQPAGARVSVDGLVRGTSPVSITDLTPGEHAVAIESDLGSVKQTVTIEPAKTASLMVPLNTSEAAFVSGWMAVSAPVEVQIFENKRLLGTSQSDRLMVTAGRHEVEIVNDTLGFRTTRTVQVSAGKVTPIHIDFPKGSIALNALPWAEVWVDGERIGETPIGNLSLAIGAHEIVFRHPELGEQRHAATVTLKAPARLSVDMRKK
jgi:serine/threonine protein kinase